MAALSTFCEIRENLTTEQRIELVLDLDRRVKLLEDLLSAAREKRRASEAAVCLVEAERAELNCMS